MENFDASLWNVYHSLLGQFSGITDLANALAALGALIYVSVRVFSAMSRGGEIDIFPLLRPFAIGICIVLFNPLILTPLNAVTEAVNNGVESIALRNETQLDELRKERTRLEEKIREKKDDETAWYDINGQLANAFSSMKTELADGLQSVFHWLVEAIYFCAEIILKSLRIFFLLMLAIIGPLVFGFALFDGISGGIPAWFSRYISISLWSSVISILKALLNTIHIHLMKLEIVDLQAELSGGIEGGTDYYSLAFYVVGILGFFAVPTIAGWIVEAGGGVGHYGAAVNNVGRGTAGGVGRFGFGMLGLGRGLTADMGRKTGRAIGNFLKR